MEIKATHKTWLKKRAAQSHDLSDIEKKLVTRDTVYPVDSYEEVDGGHYLVKLGFESGSWYIWGEHWFLPWEDQDETIEPQYVFSADELKAIMPNAQDTDIATYLEPINRCLNDFDILTTKRAAAFVAQVAHESGSLRYKEEIADGSAYEGRQDLGNIFPGDGKRYKGRGLIQLTGRYNYRTAGKAMNLPLEDYPEQVVKDPVINAAVAGWYWQSRNISAAADEEDFERVTRLVNGGLNGYPDRVAYWERAKKVLNPAISQEIPSTWQEIDWHNPQAKVSCYFVVREVTLGDSRRIPSDDTIKANICQLAKELDQVREEWGSPIIVTSWYRPPAVNKAVGGVSNSQHISGKAADIKPAFGDIGKFQEWLDVHAWKSKALGYGAKKGFVHIDLRPTSLRWNY
jgi:putative chitinase